MSDYRLHRYEPSKGCSGFCKVCGLDEARCIVEERRQRSEAIERSKSCEHIDFEARVAVNRFEDQLPMGFTADITIHCKGCGVPMRFKGLAAGLSFDRPMVSIDGLELHIPLGVGPQMQAGARFEMPKLHEGGKQ